MSQKRFLRILSYEGNEEWMKITLANNVTNKHKSNTKTFFTSKGTVREVHCVEVKDTEAFNDVLRRIADETR